MDARKIATMIFKLTIKMVVIAALVAVCYVVCLTTFKYGEDLFSQEAMAKMGHGETVLVTIPYNTSAEELGDILKTNGLIKNADMFPVQAWLYDLTITPGNYQFSTEDNIEDIIDIINAAKPKKNKK